MLFYMIARYDPKSKTNSVLIDYVSMANGITLSQKEDYLLYGELGTAKIWKLHLKGAKKGQKELFAMVPGAPDNITPNGKDGFFVAIAMPVHPDKFDLLIDVISKAPNVARFMTRIIYNFKLIFETIDSIYPNEICAFMSYW